MVNNQSLIPSEKIEKTILLIRQQKVMLDADLAELYGVEPRVLIQTVKRNLERFPEDFMFQLNKEEADSLRSQFVTLKKGRLRVHRFGKRKHEFISSSLWQLFGGVSYRGRH